MNFDMIGLPGEVGDVGDVLKDARPARTFVHTHIDIVTKCALHFP